MIRIEEMYRASTNLICLLMTLLVKWEANFFQSDGGGGGGGANGTEFVLFMDSIDSCRWYADSGAMLFGRACCA